MLVKPEFFHLGFWNVFEIFIKGQKHDPVDNQSRGDYWSPSPNFGRAGAFGLDTGFWLWQYSYNLLMNPCQRLRPSKSPEFQILVWNVFEIFIECQRHDRD